MKFLSFKILVLYILLPPILYVFSLESLQYYLKNKYEREIRKATSCDTCMFDGGLRLKDAIPKKIDSYLKSKVLLSWGLKADVEVRTEKGLILYPEAFGNTDIRESMPDHIKVAAENYELISQGIIVSVDVIADHNKPLSNGILAVYILIFSGLLYFYYRAGVRKAESEEEHKNKEIERLTEHEKALAYEKEKLAAEFSQMKGILETEKLKASKSEDQLIDEIVSLEKKMNENLALQNEQKDEIESLKEQIRLYEKSKIQSKKDFNVAHKRFRNLYKNLIFHDRALAGFSDLPDELKIKGEEVIHQLNDDPDLVAIKRKVFTKKGHQSVLEVVFAYKGRLYFSKTKENRIEILMIGDKNSQNKDLEFINNLT